jgi:hypothetical protein
LHTIFVETYEPTHPFGAKAVAEIPLDGLPPPLEMLFWMPVVLIYTKTGNTRKNFEGD